MAKRAKTFKTKITSNEAMSTLFTRIVLTFWASSPLGFETEVAKKSIVSCQSFFTRITSANYILAFYSITLTT